MAKREYLKNILLLVCFLNIAIYSFNANSEAWVPDVNSYKYSISFSTIDKRSKRNKQNKVKDFIDVRNKIAYFTEIKSSLTKDQLKNYENRYKQNISRTIIALNKKSKNLSAFKDKSCSDFWLEYGVLKNHSLGMKLSHFVNKFAAYNDSNDNLISKNVGIFYKYQLFRNEKWAISMSPFIEFSTETPKKLCKFIDLAFFVGYSTNKKSGYNLFHEASFLVKKYFKDTQKNKITYSASALNGVKFANGITITNFIEIQDINQGNIIYEQISISKDFYPKKPLIKQFTVQMGYFWKKNINDSKFRVSGPILSIRKSL